MAAEKKSFILYCDQIHTFEELTDEEAGKLIKHIYRYCNDQDPILEDRMVNIAFQHIKHQLKRDLRQWQKYIEKQAVNGKKGGRPKHDQETQKTQAFFKNPSQPKKADNVNVNATAINRDVVIELLQAAAPPTITHQQLEQQAELLMKQYQGQKIGNLRALCNRWMNNYQEQVTMPSVELTYWDKMRAAL